MSFGNNTKFKCINESKQKFDNIMNFANDVLVSFNKGERYKDDENKQVTEHPLIDVVRLLGRGLQTDYLTYLALCNPNDMDEANKKANIYPWNTMFDSMKNFNADGKSFYEVMRKIDSEKEIHLNKDIVLPWAWNRERLVTCISCIGEGRCWGKWQQDCNHITELWLPIGITWVSQGNHSISAGIIKGEGVIIPEKTYDISPVYEYLYCDGEYYRLKADDSKFQKVLNVEFAAIFEIGRIMVKNNISF